MKAPEVNANFCVFESQCPKIMILSKALKAKPSSIPNRVASLSMPGFNWLGGKTAAAMPSFDHPPWRHLPRAWGPVGRPFLMCMHVCFAWSFGCSLSRWSKVGLLLALWQESQPNFKGLPKVSGVTTNQWVFLWCDWSPISSWFYYQS